MKQLLTSLMDGRKWSSQTHNASVQLQPEPWLEWISSGSPVYFSLTFFLLMKVQTLQRQIKESFTSVSLKDNQEDAARPGYSLPWFPWDTVTLN